MEWLIQAEGGILLWIQENLRPAVLQGAAGLLGSHHFAALLEFFQHVRRPPLPRKQGRFIG